MSTGFSDSERELSRLVGLALKAGVPESAFGLGGMRTVGPMVTLTGNGYQVNGEIGVVLGRTYKTARAAIVGIYRAHIPAKSNPRSAPYEVARSVVREFNEWLDVNVHGDRSRAIVKAQMLDLIATDPEYWWSQSWTLIQDRAAIEAVRRTGRQFGQAIGGSEARQIARLLKGRH